MDPYRTAALAPIIKVPSNVYKFVVHATPSCPICKISVEDSERIWDGYMYKNRKFGKSDYCHPLKRIYIKGWWLWKKYCPVERVHFHRTCNKCKISWIEFSTTEFEPNYQERVL